MFKLFGALLAKDMTTSSVHTPTAIGNEDPEKGKAKPFKAFIGQVPPAVTKRTLQPNSDGETAKSPFRYDPNALGSLRPDQVPRFFGALTDGHKLPTKEVKLDDLHAMQDRVDPRKVKGIDEHGADGKKAVVVQHDGKHYIADGHHRLTAAWLNGDKTAEVHFKDLEPVDHALKRGDRTPAVGDKVEVEHDTGAASNAPWKGNVTASDGWRVKVDYDDGSDWYSFDPKDLNDSRDIEDGKVLWRFKKREPVNFKVAKVDESLGLVFGWAIVCKIDGQDYYDLNIDHSGPHAGERVPEHIPENVMAKSACEFMQTARPGNEMHDGPDKGTFVFAFPLTTDIAKAMGIITRKTGLMVAYKPPAEVLVKFVSGEYRGFSIEGRRLSFEEH